MSRVVVIAIGRNEGQRLRACLTSALACTPYVVYVDSGSTDGSYDVAYGLKAQPMRLDTSIPFTAARARNAGAKVAMAMVPPPEFLQFVDADTELARGWIAQAVKVMEQFPSLGVVCGRRRERYPEASIYNFLCDVEWETPVGSVKYCGGDAMMRAAAFTAVGGFNESLIAGEEPELCVRLRAAGWKIERLNEEMTLHDAAMTRFGQWWKRNVRAGHAFAEGAFLHGKPPERHWVKEVRSNYFWGLVLPLVSVVAAFFTHGWTLLLLPVGYGALFFKVMRYARHTHLLRGARWVLFSFFLVLSKFPQVVGQMAFARNRSLKRKATLIEYKAAGGT